MHMTFADGSVPFKEWLIIMTSSSIPSHIFSSDFSNIKIHSSVCYILTSSVHAMRERTMFLILFNLP